MQVTPQILFRADERLLVGRFCNYIRYLVQHDTRESNIGMSALDYLYDM